MSEVRDVRETLAQRQLQNPFLDFLVPDEQSFSVLFLQRRANVIATRDFVRNENGAAAQVEFVRLFRLAFDLGIDLTVAPEYSCPWAALEEAILAGVGPHVGKLWAIGCESTTLAGLEAFRQHVQERCVVLHESPDAGTKRFLDPLTYVFKTRKNSGEEVLVVLVQFKTEPMVDTDARLEPDNLIPGRIFYRFRNTGEQSISLVSILCSDALAFAKPENAAVAAHIRQISPLLLLHLQLNAKPRQTIYTAYRYDLLRQQMEREIFAANWASGTRIVETDKRIEITESMSAWFLQSDALSSDDARVAENHRLGGYPTYIGSSRSFAYLFNFEALLFQFRNTKPSQISGLAGSRARTGPEMLGLRIFNHDTSSWGAVDPAPDSCDVVFAALAPQYVVDGRAAPINTERLMLLCCGRIKRLDETPRNRDWPTLESMETCRLTQVEAIQRLTYGQDASAGATSFRSALVAQFRAFEQLKNDPASYPDRMIAFKTGAVLHWDINSPYTNLRNPDGVRACAAYLGADIPDETIPGTIYELLRSHLSSRKDQDPDHVVLWYRDLAGRIQRYPPEVSTKVDRDSSQSSVSITQA